MYNKEIALDSLKKIKLLLETILQRSDGYDDFDEMLHSPSGMLRLDAICMNITTLGEMIKGVDKQTHGELLPNYPEINWSGAMRMRDKIAHHYFEIDAGVVEQTVKQDIPPMLSIIERMIADME